MREIDLNQGLHGCVKSRSDKNKIIFKCTMRLYSSPSAANSPDAQPYVTISIALTIVRKLYRVERNNDQGLSD